MTAQATVTVREPPPVQQPEVLEAMQEPEWWLQWYAFVVGAFLALGTAVGAFISFAFSVIGVFGVIIGSIQDWLGSSRYVRPLRVAIQTIPGTSREFGSGRDRDSNGIHRRSHAGVDMQPVNSHIANVDVDQRPVVYAVAGGTVISYGLNFFAGTNVLNVRKHDGRVVRYAEIVATISTAYGTPVRQGQAIGRLHPFNATTTLVGYSMLHLEYYMGTQTRDFSHPGNMTYDYVSLVGGRTFNRRRDLLNPTHFANLPNW